ncbi:M15 family metallopeptidase [Microbacterium algeriense]|uniref:M15 family metallopeptidase n=1 Tax=Microbacterium algeriense TaxID=2615184 RepID=A0ABQ6V3U6_9MICO|nr:M15 family metallopeptidase [Microbacterium algeriense]KAB1862657.1 M15 family metallopeptidase [Microbacterium algeriense]MDX2399159.1 M15 family metallopeptidase [Microbacterium algeriense]
MNTRTIPHSSRRRRRRIAVVLTALASAVVIAFAVQQSLAAASADAVQEGTSPAAPPAPSEQIDGTVIAPSEADGVIRDGDQPTVFDVDRVAVGNLDPALLAALQRAATDAEGDGVTFLVNSGWRSPALQERLLQDAIAEYGSEAEARRWVATAETSAHVSGDAVDLGPLPTLDWIAQRGWRYGLCQIYGNESWHYELRPEAVTDGCPEMYTDPTEDPRMQP